jgi:glycogen(starch) synthase
MKVLVTTDTLGGVWTYALELTQGLAGRGVEVTLAAIGPLDRDQDAELASAPAAERVVADFALEWMRDSGSDVERSGEWLLDLAAETKPDVVHLNAFAHGALPWQVPVVVVGHSDVLSWHEAVYGHAAGDEWREYRERVAAGIAGADMLVAPTHALLEALVRLYRPACETVVIPNGRALEVPAQPKEALVLSSGRLWDEGKNIGALVRVAPRLSWPIALAGDGADEDAGGVQLLGRLPRRELDEWLARASIFALPARYEPFGLGALEAALAGCALVLGDIPSLREVWGETAMYVDPDDEDALASALRRLIHDRELRDECAARARARAAGYTPERMTKRYLDAYERLVCARAPIQETQI